MPPSPAAARRGRTGGPVTVEVWHGQTDTGKKAIEDLVADFNRTHPGIRVDLGGGVLADAMLQKITAALASGSFPDIAYIFGSDLASVARSPSVVDRHRPSSTPGPGFWAPAREAVTVNGRVRAAPALLDSLAVVCNKKLFAGAGIPLPAAGWTWAEFVGTARKLTDAGSGTFGTGWPGVGDEDTVWRLWPMVWDLGGDVIAPDGARHRVRRPGRPRPGDRPRRSPRRTQRLPRPEARQRADVPGRSNAGRMGMVATGPWQLPDIADAEDRLRGRAAAELQPPAADHLRPRHLDGVRQRRSTRGGGPHLPVLAGGPGPGRPLGRSARAACR